MMKIFFLLRKAAVSSAVLCLAACAFSGDIPRLQSWPQWKSSETQWFRLELLDPAGNVAQTSLLAVQPEAENIRFVQTDALGAPVSRQILDCQGWVNEGFVPPNRESRRLFGAILPLLTQSDDALYPQQQIRRDDGETLYLSGNRELWRIRVSDGHTDILFPDGKQWRVSQIEP